MVQIVGPVRRVGPVGQNRGAIVGDPDGGYDIDLKKLIRIGGNYTDGSLHRPGIVEQSHHAKVQGFRA
jgi:hypothetical protein